MNMTLSKRGDYVVRSALALARAYPSGEPRKIRQVVAEMGVPQTFASQILADLVRAGLAGSKAGKDGGYRLSRPPEEIPLLEVVEAGEGPLRAERCALGDGPCRWESVCPLHESWRAATDALRGVLAETTLADLVARDMEIEQGRYAVPADSHRHGGASLGVEDSVQVEVGCEAIITHLRDEQLVADTVAFAFEQAEQIRSSILAGGPPWSPGELSTSCIPRERAVPGRGPEDGQAGDGCEGVALSFEMSGPGSVSAHGELELVVANLDLMRSGLRATGRIRLPDLGGRPDDPLLVERLGQVLVRTLLRRLAHNLEAAATRTAVLPGATPRPLPG